MPDREIATARAHADADPAADAHLPPAAGGARVTWRDGLLVAIGLAFVLIGVVLLVDGRDVDRAIVTLAFFGTCFATSVYTLVRKWRGARPVRLTATVTGGVPIRPSRARAAALGGVLLALGAVMAGFGGGFGLLFTGIGWFVAAAGAVLLGGVLAGLLPAGHLQFDPAGLTIGHRRSRAIVPWAAITRLSRGELHDNPAVFMWVDRAAVTAEPPSQLHHVHRRMATSSAWAGADFVIMSGTYGIDATVLVAALQRCIDDPDARAALQPRPALAC